ncbi:hypothetical protein D1AOALGA4SA_11899 [Olavius algarvensis Delta 1 endosymbiont]|nr:hypothetical protein D1AOALGA4SA_11899 [Olavius algarvensis Delta 1 endosymbiont]
MATFFMFGKYTSQAVEKISAERTNQAVGEIKKLGGEVQAMHVLLGEYDLLFCVALPGIEAAMKASVTLSKLTGISFTTCPAVSVETFDSLVET